MTARYTIDPGQSRFTVQAFAGGLLSLFAHNPVIAIRDFRGEMQFSPDTVESTSFQMTIRADSLQVIDNVPERDRPEVDSTMRKDVLETATYPEITFRSTDVAANKIADSWYRLQLKGELSLHGVVHTQLVDAQLRLPEDGVRLSGEFTLALSAYRIKRVSVLAGTITLKDEMKFSFDLVGRKSV